MIQRTKFHVAVLTLSINHHINFLEHLKQGFKRQLSWNKHRSKGKAQAKSNNLDYMINPTVRNIDRLFDQLYKVDNKDPVRNYFLSITCH